jgi:hypothetical protein
MEELSQEIIKSATGYVDKMIDPPLKEIEQLLGDRVNYWRFKNKIKTILKAKKFLEENGINPKKILPNIFVPLIEEAGNTDDEKLADMYASLLTCHVNPETQDKVYPSYAKTLAQLSSLDAHILDSMYTEIYQNRLDYRKNGYTIDAVCKAFKISNNLALLSLQNIWRLGICDHGTGFDQLNQERQILFTDFGLNFITACKVIR